jgi:hypothetical protein
MYYRITVLFILFFLSGCNDSIHFDKLLVDKIIFVKYSLSIPNLDTEYDDFTDEGHRKFLRDSFNPKSIYIIHNNSFECFLNGYNDSLNGYYQAKFENNNIKRLNRLLKELNYKYCDTISRTEFKGLYCGPAYYLQLYYQNKIKTFRLGHWKYENVQLNNLIEYIDSLDNQCNLIRLKNNINILKIRESILRELYTDETIPRLKSRIKFLPPIIKEY